LQKLPPWNDFLFHGIYEGALRELILRGKFNGSLDALESLGRMLAALCKEHYSTALPPQVLIPMPLHQSRLRERGLDQCLEMARPLARALDIPLRPDLLRRVSTAAPQASLDREARKRLRQPFVASPEVAGLRILLIDDICTTGATLSRATEALLAAGALSVDVAVVARTSLHSAYSGQPHQGHSRALP
jgi:ComF family protein